MSLQWEVPACTTRGYSLPALLPNVLPVAAIRRPSHHGNVIVDLLTGCLAARNATPASGAGALCLDEALWIPRRIGGHHVMPGAQGSVLKGCVCGNGRPSVADGIAVSRDKGC